MDNDQLLKNIVDAAGNAIKSGVDVTSKKVTDTIIENKKFMKKFIEICMAGYNLGWHERNGGNLTYRLTDKEVNESEKFFNKERPWVQMDVCDNTLANSYFISTASGAHMKNMQIDTKHSCGIVKINEEGDAYKIVWGLEDGVKPTSEFSSHYLNHCVRVKKTDGSSRVIYHAHPANLIALSSVLPVEAKVYSRVLWKVMTECVVIFPEGVGVLPWMMPGGSKIAQATSLLMDNFQSVVWSQHGIFCSGDTLDDAFGLMHTIEKASEIYLKQCNLAAAMGLYKKSDKYNDKFPNSISDANLLKIAEDFNVEINKEFLKLE